ncbi:MAG: copper-translocating P-type ATPase [Leptospiraceae bacterium]|nr:copper-translocating P-type ATPase [Leptospiraceae bacterium]
MEEVEQKEKKDSITLDVFGMTCANCALRIERGLSKLPGISEARVNFARETVFIQSGNVSKEEILSKIEDLGYSAKDHSGENFKETQKEHEKEIGKLAVRFLISLFFSFPLFYSMVSHFSFLSFLPLPHLFMNPVFQFILATPVQFWIGFPFYKGAYRSLKNGMANMDVLVALGTSAAYGYSIYLGINWILNILKSPEHAHHLSMPALYFETSSVLLTFLLAGKWMEAVAKGKSSEAIKALLNLKPDVVRVRKGDEWIEVPSMYLKEGDEFLVKAGERITTDGIIIEGESSIDESMLTGESFPVEKKIGSNLLGGTLNGNGRLVVKASKVGDETVLASIIKTVEEAQGSRAPIQKIADKISSVFVPVVVIISLLTFIFWYFIFDSSNLSGALEKAIAVLVIACPCALGLATPVSLLVGTGNGARKGVLFRNAESLETVAALNMIAFDKTGTLTEGKPYVVDSYLNGNETNEMISIIASAESSSEHPLAKAIVKYAEENKIKFPEPKDVQVEPGGGLRARVEDDFVVIGKKDFLESNGWKLPEELLSKSEEWEKNAKTIIWARIDGDSTSWGLFAIEDKIKDESPDIINKLKSINIEPLLLTGDNPGTANSVAEKLGIIKFEASLLPQDKLKIIQEFQNKGLKIGMAGDGINDAPALAKADVGFAMGNGTDIAMETAGVVIIKGDIGKIYESIRISKATVNNIKQNLFWALAYNTIGIPIAAMGFLAPWIAGAAMAFSSLSVVLNALRMKAK